MKFFKLQKKVKIKEGCLFVVNKGSYGGDYLVLIKKENTNFKFLVLPDLQSRDIEEEVFTRGIELEVVKFIEVLPISIFNTCKLQYEKINNSYELCTTDKNN